LDVFSEIVADSSEDLPTSTSEVNRYFSVPIIDFKNRVTLFAVVTVLSRIFNSSSAILVYISVPSGWLFSAAGDLHDENRPELSEELLFMQNNLPCKFTQYVKKYSVSPNVLF